MFGFGQLIEILKKSPKRIVFTEGSDSRILEASSRLLASNFLHPILVGDPDEIYEAAEDSGFNIRGSEILILRIFRIWKKWLICSVSLERVRELQTGAGKRDIKGEQLFRYYACQDGIC